MKRLIMCQGLPGSGKTTWALAACRSNLDNGPATVRVNKDDIRRQLESEGWHWSTQNEQRVLEIRDACIQDAFEDGAQVVISDDTNFGRKHKVRLAELAAEHNAIFEVKRFDTPVGECVRRDALREGKAHVGEKVIMDMASRYHVNVEPFYDRFAAYVNTPGKPLCVICDLDGTLALMNGRNPYDASTCESDLFNAPVLMTIRALSHYSGLLVIYLSGRSSQYHAQTERWLKSGLAPDGLLYMRPDGDTRPDWLVKGELFDAHVRDRFNVLCVLDDRDQVVKLWRHIGLTCFQVNFGNF